MAKSTALRILPFVIACLVSTTSSIAQPTPKEGDFCATASGDYASYEPRVAAAKRALSELERAGASPERIEAKRTELADLLFQQDCLRPDLLAEPVRGPAAEPRWVTLTAYYATNRQAGPVNGSSASYTGNRNTVGITLGKVSVSIPTQRALTGPH
jgi:hypothetical protein